MEYCKKENLPEYEKCYKECELALPDPINGISKEDAVKNCRKICKTKLREDRLNCYHSKLVKCARKCAKERAKECRRNKRNCKRNARRDKRNCKNIARVNKRNCINNCNNTLRGRQKRRCRRNCRRIFRGAKRQCNRTFRNQKRQCKSVNCKKSTFSQECLDECK